jgi:hypothetical protein
MGQFSFRYGLPPNRRGLRPRLRHILRRINGWLVAVMKLPPFIVTLGMWQIVLATNFPLFRQRDHPQPGHRRQAPLLQFIRQQVRSSAAPTFTYGVIFMVLLVLFLAYVLKQTAWGRHVYAVGDDPEAANCPASGQAHADLGLHAVGPDLRLCRLGPDRPHRLGLADIGQLGNIESITAVVIGGISLFGGRGSIMGMLFRRADRRRLRSACGCSAPTRNGPTCSSACSSSPPSPSTSGSERCRLMEPILKARGLVKRYGKVVALDNCDFDLMPAKSWPSSATTAPASRP